MKKREEKYRKRCQWLNLMLTTDLSKCFLKNEDSEGIIKAKSPCSSKPPYPKKEYTLKIKASERGPSAQVASLEILSSGSVFRKSSPHDNGRKTAANKIKNIFLFSFITTIFRRLGLRLYSCYRDVGNNRY